jgi:hypothetical protein
MGCRSECPRSGAAGREAPSMPRCRPAEPRPQVPRSSRPSWWPAPAVEKKPGGEAQDRGLRPSAARQLCPTRRCAPPRHNSILPLRGAVEIRSRPGRKEAGSAQPPSARGGVWLTHCYQRSGLSFPINWFISTGPELYLTVECDRVDDLRRRRRLPGNEHPLSVC